MTFDSSIGVDFSGARGPHLPSLRVVRVDRGTITEVPSPDRRGWTHEELGDYLLNTAKSQRLLVGFDFAFTHPWRDGSYFPTVCAGPTNASDLWAWVARQPCAPADIAEGILADYCLTRSKRGRYYLPDQPRRVDQALRRLGLPASHPAHAVGPNQVALASLAGMRLLHRLELSGWHIWPFEEPAPGVSVAVEAYPTLAYRLLGLPTTRQGRLMATPEALTRLLGRAPDLEFRGPHAQDTADAAIIAATLWRMQSDPYAFARPEGSPHEGWVFGLPFSDPVSIDLPDEAATRALGAGFAHRLTSGEVGWLEGPLGAGKTTFVRGLLAALGHTGPVRSPTFNLIQTYTTSPEVAHVDLYRLSGTEDLDLAEVAAGRVIWIEWPDRQIEFPPEACWRVRLDFVGEGRRATVTPPLRGSLRSGR